MKDFSHKAADYPLGKHKPDLESYFDFAESAKVVDS